MPRIGAIGFTINNKGYVGLGTDGNGTCFNDLWSFSHEGSVGISGSDNQKLIVNVYPNPFSERTTLTLNDFCSSCSLEIYDALGQKNFATNFSGTQIDITLPAFERGLYFFSVHKETITVADGKLVVE